MYGIQYDSSSLAAVLLDGLSEQPAKDSERVSVRPDPHGFEVFKYFLNTCEEYCHIKEILELIRR